MSLIHVSARQLRRAATIKDKIDALNSELNKILKGGEVGNGKMAAPKKRRKMSAAGRARIIAAQKARWAKVKTVKK